MKYQSILIVTYGRSGSTLLQGVLNTLDGVLIRGENYDFCWGLYCAWLSLVKTKKNFGSKSIPSPLSAWYGADSVKPDAFLKQASQLVAEQLLPDNIEDNVCYGFKEIRYIHHLKHLPGFLTFLSAVFPTPAFIFNTRNHDEVRNSGWWKDQDQRAVRQKLLEADRIFHKVAEVNANAFLMRYEEMLKGVEGFVPLFEFLGANYDPGRVEAVLRKPHSYGQRKETLLKAGVLNRAGN